MSVSFAPTLADLLVATWPNGTAKRVAQAARRSYRTTEAWVQQRTRPDADTLLRMAHENQELRAELVRLLGDWNADMDQACAGQVDTAARDVGGPARGQARSARAADAVRLNAWGDALSGPVLAAR